LLLVIGVLAFRIPGTPDPVGDTFGLQGRLEIWSRAIFALQDFPLTGLSMNGFRRVVHLLYPLFTISPELDLAHAHNHLLQAGLDLGLGGLIAYLSLWLIAAFLLWQSWQHLQHVHRRNQPLHVLIVGLSGSFVAAWVFGIMDAITLGARPGFIWWLLLALLTSVHDHARQSALAAALPLSEEASADGRRIALRTAAHRTVAHRVAITSLSLTDTHGRAALFSGRIYPGRPRPYHQFVTGRPCLRHQAMLSLLYCKGNAMNIKFTIMRSSGGGHVSQDDMPPLFFFKGL
jgi:hypothetical protein